MKYRASTDGTEIIKKDYRKKIIFSLDDFDEKGHLLQLVTIPPDTRQRRHSHDKQTEVFFILEGQAILTINEVDYPAQAGDAFTRGCGAVRRAMFTIYGIRPIKSSGSWSLRSTCQKRGKTATGRSHLACRVERRIYINPSWSLRSMLCGRRGCRPTPSKGVRRREASRIPLYSWLMRLSFPLSVMKGEPDSQNTRLPLPITVILLQEPSRVIVFACPRISAAAPLQVKVKV